MSVPESPESTTINVPPPPLPHKVLLLRIAWISGLVLGAAQVLFAILLLLGFSFTHGPSAPFSLYAAAVAAAVQAFSAYRIHDGSVSARIIFAVATALMMLFVLTFGVIFFAAVNAIPLVLLVLSHSPRPSHPNETSAPAEAIDSTINEAPQSRGEDLY